LGLFKVAANFAFLKKIMFFATISHGTMNLNSEYLLFMLLDNNLDHTFCFAYYLTSTFSRLNQPREALVLFVLSIHLHLHPIPNN
ncbi:hypothetical protein ACJX0J_010001, partial [Zea mays]